MSITKSPDYFIPVHPQGFYEFSSLKDPSLSSQIDIFGAKEIKSLTTQTSMLVTGLFTASNHTSTNQSLCYFTGILGSSFLINTTTQVFQKAFQLTNKQTDTLGACVAGCSAPIIAATTIGLPLPIEGIAVVSAFTGLTLGGSTYIAHSIYDSYYQKNKHRSSTELPLSQQQNLNDRGSP